MSVPEIVDTFLSAVNSRDSEAVERCFAPDAVYHFCVPAEPVVGRQAIAAVFARILGSASRVDWEILSSAVAGDHVWLERIDRFWFNGKETPIECMGVFELGRHGLIEAVRDYCDVSVWRTRKGEAQP